MKREVIAMAFICRNLASIAQEPIQEHHIRESDMIWSTRIWREIDLRQKINLPFYCPLGGW